MAECSSNGRFFSYGFQRVGNLSNRELTPAETKGLSFCPAPKKMDTFALRKDVSDFVRR